MCCEGLSFSIQSDTQPARPEPVEGRARSYFDKLSMSDFHQ